MGLNLFDLLLPRETKFFKYMNKQASIFNESCILLNELIKDIEKIDASDIKKRVAEIKELELRGDKIERFIIDELHKTFITPIDREDIHAIVTNIDHCTDIINDIAQKIDIYKIKKFPKNALLFSDIIKESSDEMKKLIRCLDKRENVKPFLNRIHEIESEADNLFHKSIARLFEKRGKNPIDMIKFKEIFEHLEETVDSIEYIATLVRGVMVKHG